eukprot:sb/3468231/
MEFSESLRKEFQENGAVVVRGMFSDEWLDKVAAGIDSNLANPSKYSERVKGDIGDGDYFNDYMNWQEIPNFVDFIHNSPAPHLAKFLLNTEKLVFYHEHVLVKEPQTGKRTPWHQDQPYYPMDGKQVLSIWMPLDRVELMETLLFFKGSHKLPYFMPYKFVTERPYPIENEDLQKKMKFPPLPNEDQLGEIIGWDVSPGDCVVFAGTTIHGAPPNLTNTTRRVLSTRWLGDDVVCAERPWTTSPPVQGSLKPGDRFVQDGLFPEIKC